MCGNPSGDFASEEQAPRLLRPLSPASAVPGLEGNIAADVGFDAEVEKTPEV